MTTIAIDTHQAIQRLTAKGFSADQAEGIVEVLANNELVTKSDLKVAISDLKAELTKLMLLQTGATVGILSGLYAMFG
jgi:hypothetical protein